MGNHAVHFIKLLVIYKLVERCSAGNGEGLMFIKNPAPDGHRPRQPLHPVDETPLSCRMSPTLFDHHLIQFLYDIAQSFSDQSALLAKLVNFYLVMMNGTSAHDTFSSFICGVCPTYLNKICGFDFDTNATFIFDNHCVMDLYNCIHGTEFINQHYENCLFFGNFAYVHGLKHEDYDYGEDHILIRDTKKNPDFV